MTSDRFMIQFCKISNYFSDKNTKQPQLLQLTSVLLQKIDIFVSDLCKMLGGAGSSSSPRKCGVFISSIFRSRAVQRFEGNAPRVH